jgi:hypothetical protein
MGGIQIFRNAKEIIRRIQTSAKCRHISEDILKDIPPSEDGQWMGFVFGKGKEEKYYFFKCDLTIIIIVSHRYLLIYLSKPISSISLKII